MEILDKIGVAASKVYCVTVDKTDRLTKEAKIKIKMSNLKSDIEDIYMAIGKEVYNLYLTKQDKSINENLRIDCMRIDDISFEIDELSKKVLELKNKKKCYNCFTEIGRCDNFCFNCGEEQPRIGKSDKICNRNKEEKTKNKNEDINLGLEKNYYEKEEDNNEKQEEYKIFSDKQLENLQKTIEIESSINLDNEDEDENQIK